MIYQAEEETTVETRPAGRYDKWWVLSSPTAALGLVALLILQCVVGVVVPQTGVMGAEEAARWQGVHPLLSAVARPLGGFDVFHSWPFLGTILLLACSTIWCSVRRVCARDGMGLEKERKAGFLAVHFSIVAILAGAFVSAATGMEGFIILTEGETFIESHAHYARLVEGPLRKDRHTHAELRLRKVEVHYAAKQHPVSLTSELEVGGKGEKTWRGRVGVNHPLQYQGMTITQDETGFSPRLAIRRTGTDELLLDAYVALKTFRTPQGREYRDILPLTCLGNRIYLTFFPRSEIVGGTIRKTGDEVENPLLMIETGDDSGRITGTYRLAPGQDTVVGDYTLRLADLRRWSAFKVSRDPGYPLMCAAFVLGIAALVWRYFRDLKQWFMEG